MKYAQKKQLQQLLKKGVANLSETEKTEYAHLSELAKKSNYNPKDDEGTLSDSDVSDLIRENTESVLVEQGIVTKSALAEALKSLPSSATVDEINAIVRKSIADAMPKASGVSLDTVKSMLDEQAATFRRESKMQHEIDVPFGDTEGNLTVARKQLLNTLLMNSCPSVFQKSKKARPTHQDEGISETQMKKAISNSRRVIENMQLVMKGQKALTSAGVGSGFELTNTELSLDLQARLYLASELAQMMVRSEIQMPSEPYRFPITTTRPTFYVGSEGGAQQTSTPGTGSIILTAMKLIGQVDYSYEADEDSLIAILPMLQERMGEAAADALENAFINGDTSHTMDSDTAALTNDSSWLFNGLRKAAIAGGLTLNLATGGVSAANVAAMRKAMGWYGKNPNDLLLICGTSAYNDFIQLPETQTMIQVGNQARILTGVAPQIYGINIIVSSRVRENVNASGVYDGTTTNQGMFLLVHTPSWIVGARQNFLVESWRDTRTQLNSIIASFRRAFQPRETPTATGSNGSAIQSVMVGYGYTA